MPDAVLFVANEFAWFFLIVLPLAWLTRPHLGVWKVVMIVAGLVFYGWWRRSEEDWWILGTIPGRYCAYLLLFAVINWALALFADAWRRSGRRHEHRRCLACVVDLGALFWFKYAEWAAGQLNDRVGSDLRLGQIILPIGVSFIAFQALGYVIDVHRGTPGDDQPQRFHLLPAVLPAHRRRAAGSGERVRPAALRAVPTHDASMRREPCSSSPRASSRR